MNAEIAENILKMELSGSLDKYKILIIGNHNSIFIYNYSKVLKSNYPEAQITILSLDSETANFDYFEYGITLLIPNKGLKRDNFFIIRFFHFLRSLGKILRKYNDSYFDIIHIHYYVYYIALLKSAFLHCGKKIVISIWGSDFYKAKKRHIAIQKILLPSVARISFSNPKTREAFLERFGIKYEKVSTICRFGLFPLDELQKIEHTSKTKAKQLLGIEENKIAITCGYYANRIFQHVRIIRQIRQLPEELIKRIVLIFPFTYGDRSVYALAVEKEAKEARIPFFSFRQQLNDERIALLRKASDILIHLPFSDQFSGTMQEYIYADNAIISGKWLPYEPLEEKGIKLIKIGCVDELLPTLQETINHIDKYRFTNNCNKKAIMELSSWQANFPKWVKFYTERSGQ